MVPCEGISSIGFLAAHPTKALKKAEASSASTTAFLIVLTVLCFLLFIKDEEAQD